ETGPPNPIPTACVNGESAPWKTARPPPASKIAAPGWPSAQPRAIAASADSTRRARATPAKIISFLPVTVYGGTNCDLRHHLSHHISIKTGTVQLTVKGMTCDNCARSVERKLASTAGVTKATVDLKGERANVEYNTDLVKPEVLAN